MSLFNIYGPINDLGYGQFTLGILDGFSQLGINLFHTSPIGQPQLEEPTRYASLLKQTTAIPWSRTVPSVAVWHEFDLSKFSGKNLIAFPIFETTGFFPLAQHHLRQMDGICVASQWAKAVVEASIGTDIPVFVVPGGADILNSEAIESTKKSDCFTFLFVGKYEQRKSPLELIQAYVNAFSKVDADTRLICHCYNPFDRDFKRNISNILTKLGLNITNSTVRTSIVATCGNAIVEIPEGRITRQQLFQLYKYCHVGVFPSKGEGWNLPLMEAIQSGVPCIATNHSAHTEYLSNEFNYPQELLLNSFQLQPAVDGVYFKGDRGNWAVVDVRELEAKLVTVYNNYTNFVNFDNSKIKDTFTWKNTAKKLFNVIQSYY